MSEQFEALRSEKRSKSSTRTLHHCPGRESPPARLHGSGETVRTSSQRFRSTARISAVRFDGGESDTRFLVGINWGVSPRGKVRAAVDFGLSDGAPDFEALVGYAFQF